jgi:general secretion pathway protein D
MSLRLLRLSLATCLTVAALKGQTPSTEPTPAVAAPVAAADELVGPIKLPDADIDTVLGLLEIYTERSVLRPQQLPTATYRLVIDRKIPKSEAILALETVLALNQVGVAPLGDKFLKVVALSQVKTEAPEMVAGSTLDLPPSGRIVTKLFQLNFLRVNEFIPQITPMMSPGVANGIVPLEKANAALITDSVSNLQRVELLLQQLDAPMMAGLTPKFYQLSHGAKASDVVNKLRAMFQGPLQNQLGAAISYSADDRTNQIILLADQRQLPLFDDLIPKLDVTAEPNTRQELISLKHAAAKEVAALLSLLVSGQNAASQKASGGSTVRNPAGQPAAPNPPAAVDAASLGMVEGTNEFSSLITILPDERSNAVVVSGTVDDIRLIRDLVDKLDIVLAQVRIEIVIAEVTLSDSATSGISQLGLQVEGGRLTGITGTAAGATLAGTTTTGMATLNPNFFIKGGELNLTGLVSLSTTPRKDNTTILSVPTITTTHNKEAKIFVGQTRPTINGTTSSNASVGATTPFTTSSITQQEVGITITVKPLIGNDGSVQLDLKQEISDVGSEVITIDGNQQNVILKRTTSSFITARSGEILVLGGLQKKSNSRSRTRLGPIPIIGDLLGRRSRSEDRTELVFFLRPVVLTNSAADNATAMKQLEQLPNKDAVRKELDPNYVPPKKSVLDKILGK